MRGNKVFTLIELIMIIVILGVLAAVAIPRYYDLQSDANTAAEKGVVGGVRAGIQTYFAQNKAFPATLDGNAGAPTACSADAPCFDTILSQGGITEGWTKQGATTYTGPDTDTGLTYTYTVGDGGFIGN